MPAANDRARDPVALARRVFARLADTIAECGESRRPCIGIVSLDRAAGGKNFTRLAALEAADAERAHELKIHFRTLEADNAGCGSFDARHRRFPSAGT
jgi:hypothetical protein